MIHDIKRSVLETDAEALVNTVNMLGHMGKGLALEFKSRYPANNEAYRAACERHEVRTGRMFVTEVVTEQADMFAPRSSLRWIVNFPTKQDWHNGSQMRWIVSGLADLRRVIVEKNIRSIAIPPLGCGNGGLDWLEVRPLIVSALEDLQDCRIIICSPRETGSKAA